jgi:hypothetical protein
MENAATGRGRELRNSPSRGGKRAQNAKKVVGQKEAKELLKIKELAFFGGSKRTAFSGQKPPTKANNTAKNPPLVGHFPVCARPDGQAYP